MTRVCAATLVLLLSACSKQAEQPPAPASTAAIAPAAPTVVEQSAPDPKAGAKIVIAFMTALQNETKDLDVRPPIKRHTAEDDPNHMLGRQHGYIEKLAFNAAGGESSLEVFSNLSDAKARYAYVDGISKASPALGDGYDYLNEQRFALLRLAREVAPAQATKWKALLDTL